MSMLKFTFNVNFAAITVFLEKPTSFSVVDRPQRTCSTPAATFSIGPCRFTNELIIILFVSFTQFSYIAIANESPTNPSSDLTSVLQKSSNDEAYTHLISKSQASDHQDRAIELIASGSAATLVGVYGYYFDERGSFAKLAYFATQTAGIFVLGEGIKKHHSRSLVLDLNSKITGDNIDRNTIKQIVIENEFYNRYAKHRADAWTAGLLGGLYTFNAIRAQNDATNLRSIYVFLATNALAVCGYNTYQIFNMDRSSQLQTQFGLSGLQVTWTY